jgi:hypothetical protein
MLIFIKELLSKLDLKTKIFIAITAILVVLLTFFYIKWTIIKSELQTTKDNLSISSQNELALHDQLNAAKDSVVIYAIQVAELKNEKEIADKKSSILQTKVLILLDSIERLKQPAIADVSDTNTISVKFAGKEKILTYEGKTYFYKKDSTSAFDIKFVFVPISIFNEIYFDEKEYIKSYISTDNGVVLKTSTVIDPKIFLLLKHAEDNEILIQSQGFFDKLKVFGKGNIVLNSEQIKNYTLKDVNNSLSLELGIKYDFESGFSPYISKNLNTVGVIVGFGYSKSIRDLVKIF